MLDDAVTASVRQVMRLLPRILLLCWMFVAIPPLSARPPLVLAAASLQESLEAAAAAWAAKGHPKPILSFAASSALARQINAGSPADLFLSADEPWMDVVEKAGHVRAGSRTSFLANKLVLIAPKANAKPITIRAGFPLAALLNGGRLAMADPDAVPAGKYGKAALTSLGVWPAVAASIAPGDSVRAALSYVERGQTPYGIVYATDAAASQAVRVVGLFPPNSYPPITYPIALLTSATSPDATAFERFLLSRAGRAIFYRHGFLPK